ncbi:AfsR/SARP family transcriptional regulator, partial [Streptomyces sp. 150FB]|uniref:AfsR/SARP family transcriptional regulator n=1 Tax=Streptomyces sp. 150FB TaxID=1576605 RepID=UPI000695E84A
MLRATLAVLALRPGRIVPADDLADRLWGEALPANPRTTLRNYVMRLRKILPGDRICTVSGGYQLRAESDETDLGLFRALLLRSRELAAGAPGAAAHDAAAARAETLVEAAALLDRAVELWRGNPLAGIGDCALHAAEQPRLEELRLAAVEERFDAYLALGRHATLIDELTAAATAHPLRERFTRQLMLALHRCGRTAEALGVYRTARGRLVDELGIEPGTELRELERAILRDDPDLAPPPGPPPAPRTPPPAPPPAESESEFESASASHTLVPGPRTAPPAETEEATVRPESTPPADTAALHVPTSRKNTSTFPPGIGTFVAREAERGRLSAWLTEALSAPTICLLDGPGGVGKSSLAVRAAREAADLFPDGLVYVDLHGADPRNAPLGPAEALQTLLPALGVERGLVPQQESAAVALYHEQLKDKRVLILLDNTVAPDQVAPLLPGRPGCAALVTSRTVLTGIDGAHHLHLDALGTEDAVALVRTVAGRSRARADDGRADLVDDGQWEELVALCGRLPLALRIIATRMASRPRWSLADWTATLRDERGRMDELSVADLDVRASLTVSIEQLALSRAPAARRAAQLFPLLGTSSVSSYCADSAAALAECTPGEAGLALDRLADAQIAASPRPRTYVLHDLVRATAAWQAARLPEERTYASLVGLARWYLGSLHRVNAPMRLVETFRVRCLRGAERFPEGLSFDSTESALAWADDALDDVVALAEQLARPEYDGRADLGGVGVAVAVGGAGLTRTPLSGAPLSAFALEVTRALESYFGIRLRWRAQRQLCELTMRVGERLRDEFAQAVALSQLGKCHGQQGEGRRGAELLERGAAKFQSLGLRTEMLVAQSNLVPCLASSGRLEEAMETGRRALAEAEEYGPSDVAHSLMNNLGQCHLHLGDHAEARRLLTRNYEVADVPHSLVATAGALAEHALVTGEFEEAARWADRGLGHAAEQPFDPYEVARQHAILAAA